jgi:hypothetical protein
MISSWINGQTTGISPEGLLNPQFQWRAVIWALTPLDTPREIRGKSSALFPPSKPPSRFCPPNPGSLRDDPKRKICDHTLQFLLWGWRFPASIRRPVAVRDLPQGQAFCASAALDRVKDMYPKARSSLCPHQKLFLEMLEHGWTIPKIKTSANMKGPDDPGYLVDEAARESSNNISAEFNYVSLLGTDPVDRSEVH